MFRKAGYVVVNCLDLRLPRKSVIRLTDCLNMTIVFDMHIKPQNKETKIQISYSASVGWENERLIKWS